MPHPAGIYRASAFRHPFTAVIGQDLGIRDSGESEPFLYIGQDKNAAKGDEEFDAMILSRVFDPQDQRSLDDMPRGVQKWFGDHPRLRLVTDTAVSLTVDGLPATQADYLPADPVVCGQWHADLECVLIGYGPPGDEPFILFGGSRLRVVVVDHPAGPIVFTYQDRAADGVFLEHVGVFDGWVRSVDFG